MPPASTHVAAHALDVVERCTALDPPATLLRKLAGPLQSRRGLANLVAGVPLGHPAHPALAQAAVGAFLSAGALDALGRPGDRDASSSLIALGLAAAAPAALTGLSDLSHGHEQQQRTGVVHATLNGSAVVLYAAALTRRRRGGSGRGLSLLATALSGTAAYVGGHLAYRQALGPNHAEHVPHRVPPGWSTLCRLDDVPQGTPVSRVLGDQPLVVVRDGDRVDVLSDVCPHLSGPLHEGELADGCLTCPWHGSTFRLSDGEPVTGPATAPVPRFEVRVEDGEIRVLLPGAG